MEEMTFFHEEVTASHQMVRRNNYDFQRRKNEQDMSKDLTHYLNFVSRYVLPLHYQSLLLQNCFVYVHYLHFHYVLFTFLPFVGMMDSSLATVSSKVSSACKLTFQSENMFE
jgi:hypothetical protein